MTYYLLATALCLAVLFIAMTGTFAVCALVSRVPASWLRSRTPRSQADIFFGVLISPLLFACLAAFGLALPAFLKFEPRSTGETMEAKLLVLALAGAGITAAMLVRWIRAWRS